MSESKGSGFQRKRIGDVPEEWDIEALGGIAVRIQDGTHFSPQTEGGPCRYVTSKNIRFGSMELETCGWISEAEHRNIYARCPVQFGDVLLTKDGANTGNAALNKLHEPFSMLSSVALIRLDDKRFINSYLLHYLLSARCQQRLKDLMSGNAITRLTLQKINAFEVPFPDDPAEQRRIAEILDTADEAIQKTEALIAKLKQMKAGLLHDLLTRGIDENGFDDPTNDYRRFAFAPSTKEDANWEAVTVRQLMERGIISKVQDGNHGEKHPKAADFVPEGIPFLMANDLKNGRVDFNECHFIRREQYEGLRIGFAKPRNVLLSHKGTIGQTAIVPEDRPDVMLTPQVTYYAITKEAELIPEFLMYWFQSRWFKRQFSILSEQSTRKFLGITGQRDLQVLLPPHDDQQFIVDRVKSLDDRITRESEVLTKQKLLKAGLMHDLLTGKKRVNQPAVATA